ncbi:MAG: hypothetical protein M1821_008795 [Bathelium mastoideum]|nr:MAG: hypothetical protein M1821_008795 [Bathelium mastoideum]
MSSDFPTRQLNTLTGHNGPVHAVTYSAGSGQYVSEPPHPFPCSLLSPRTSPTDPNPTTQILTGAADRTIRLFNPSAPASAQLIQAFHAHAYPVLALAVARSNASFASGGGDKTVFVWDTATAATRRRWTGAHAGRVNAVAWGGGGGGGQEEEQVVVSASVDASVKVWDVRAGGGKAMMSLEEARDSVSSVVVVGAEIVAGSVDGRVRVYDVRMGMCYVDVVGHPVTSVTPTMQNDSLLVSSLDSTIRLFDKADGKLLQSYTDADYQNENYRIGSTLALKDNHVLSGSENGCIFVWSHLTGKVTHQLRHGSGEKGSSKKDVGTL